MRLGADESDGAPGWLWGTVLVAVTALIALSLIGVSLAMAGLYRTWLVLPLTAVVTVVAVPLLWRLVDEEHDASRTGRWCAVASVALLVGLGVWSANHSSHHVVTYHDPGVYASTAVFISSDGSLRTRVGDPADEPLVDAVLQRFAEADVTAPGAYEAGSEHLEYQFSHSPSVVMASAYDLAGRRGLFASPTAAGVVALLATYLLITRFVRRAPLALAGTVALGLTTPFLYITRGTYSEPFALAMIATGLAVLTIRRDLTPLRSATVGLCIGASVLFRIDGQLAVVALVGVGAVAAFTGTSGRALLCGAGAAAVPVSIGLADLIWFSGDYWNDQPAFDSLVRVATLVGVFVVALLFMWRERPWATRLRERWIPAAATASAIVVSATLAALWVVRPRLQVARADWGPDDPYAHRVEQLQEAAGLAADGTRSYAELTVAAIGWYLGPVAMVLAVIGSGLMVQRALRSIAGHTARAMAFWVMTIPPFLLDWRITPYQPWASRRFIPIILPAIVIFAAVAGDHIVSWFGRWAARRGERAGSWLERTAVGVLCVLLVVPAGLAMSPVRNLAEQRGFIGGLDQGCAVIDGRTVLSVGSSQFNVPLRAWCDVPTVAVPAVEHTTIEWFAAEARSACLPAAVLISDMVQLGVFAAANVDGVLDEPVEVDLTNPWFPEESIEQRPREYVPERLNFAIATVRLPESCGPIE